MHSVSETAVGTGKPEETNNRMIKVYIKCDLQEIMFEEVDWIFLAQDGFP
jgi:hypothetical protein